MPSPSASGNNTDLIIPRNLNIGALDAETDEDLLQLCYVENGCLTQIRDTSSPASIIVGRTGAGKSATLLRLAQVESEVILIKPFELAFQYLENSTALKFFEEAGVNLDLFYRYLWRHILVTELLRYRYPARGFDNPMRWLNELVDRLHGNASKKRAVEYLQNYADKFWEETEVRLRTFADKMESELSSSLEGTALATKLKLGVGAKLSEEERAEVSTRGSQVVNRIQVKELSKIMDLLAEEIFNDPAKRYYLTIDQLDENWVASKAKFRLIRALIEEVRTFRKIPGVKIVLALRQDLLEKVFDETRDGGFQEEKYEAYFSPIRWTDTNLEELVQKRVHETFRRKYTGRAVHLEDVFPKKRGDIKPIRYIIERTFQRPRDVISFTNECFKAATDKSGISWHAMVEAERKYSEKRKKSLLDEWVQSYPSLPVLLELCNGMPESVQFDFFRPRLDELATDLCSRTGSDSVIRSFRHAYLLQGPETEDDVLAEIMCVLYRIAVFGVKLSAQEPYIWSYRDKSDITREDAKRAVHFKPHKMFYAAFGVKAGIESISA